MAQGYPNNVALNLPPSKIPWSSIFKQKRKPEMPELTLYHFPSCPYCKVVMECLGRLNLEIPMKDIRAEDGARDELIEIGGKGQVPCLVIDGKPLYESADIVSWLEEHSNE